MPQWYNTVMLRNHWADGGKKKIVIVEDEEILSELLKNKLEAAGFSVEIARDGAAGFELIKSAHPDLVLLDMMLPGMNGLKVLEHMKEVGLLPGIPVLIISNSGQPIETERAVALGARDYLIKVNFDPAEVLARVEALLEAEDHGAAPAAKDGTDSTSGHPPRGVVLVVEDDLLLQELLERKFLQEGYRLIKAFDAPGARDALKIDAPDIILLDLVLPGVDGFSFLEELRQEPATKKIPVMVISNLGQREEIEKGMASGAADYIVKAQISPGEIVKKVAAIIKR